MPQAKKNNEETVPVVEVKAELASPTFVAPLLYNGEEVEKVFAERQALSEELEKEVQRWEAIVNENGLFVQQLADAKNQLTAVQEVHLKESEQYKEEITRLIIERDSYKEAEEKWQGARKLLRASLDAFNRNVNKPLRIEGYKDTYTLAEALEKFLFKNR